MSLTDQPLRALRDLVGRGAASAAEITRAHLDRAERLDPGLNTFLHLDRAGALAAAEAVDRRRGAGEALGPLAGVPLGIKDLLCTRGMPTTAGSRILAGWTPPYDATVVARLRAADAVILGKLNLDELGMGSSNENSAFGPVRNPWRTDRAPGGSSGGSAAAVAAGLCAGTLGTDTGGSIRQPAAFCGVVGLKPTYGRASRFGLIAYASSLDQPGPLARTVRDVAALFEVVAGRDPHDATSVDSAVPSGLADLPRDADLKGLRLGVPREYLPASGLAPAVASAVREALDRLQSLGAEVVEVSLPHTSCALAAYYVIATAEASSNLARFDGVRYGHRARRGELGEMYAHTRGEGFGAEVKRRIMLGTFALSAGYHEAWYGKACQVRTLVRRDFEACFAAGVDALVTPTSPTTAFRLGERTADPLQMYLADVFTVPASLAGLPGLSVPCGFDGEGLPVGLQILGRPFDEATVLRVGAAYEDGTDWTRRRPPVSVGEGSAP